MLQLKGYQSRALEALKDYFVACKKFGKAGTAFYETTEKWIGAGLPFKSVSQMEGLPYVCIRIPTGGGKTLVACYAVGIAQKELLGADKNIILWLVPSNTIKDQTINAIKDRNHPYRHALDKSIGQVEVMDTGQALYLKKSVLLSQNVIIVSTMQAFRVEETEGRKVYEQAGELEEHFINIPADKSQDLECYNGSKKPIPSLANVLKLHRPIVIVDEAHNARTELSFDTLARFNPSCIIEFTATPKTEGEDRSNVLYKASAAELKSDNMIKIPIRLETRNDWKELLADAVKTREALEKLSDNEKQLTGEYIRPIMLLQAQRRSQTQETLTYEVIEKSLIEDFKISKEQIAVETGDRRDLEGIDLYNSDCKIKYVITVDALREGWDCPFAYVLFTVSESYSSRAVEQILGRILRLPKAEPKKNELLNIAYAYASSPNWPEVAMNLRDALVNNGFNRLEAKDLITYQEKQEELFVQQDGSGLPLWASTISVSFQNIPDTDGLSEDLKKIITIDEKAKKITFKADITEIVRDRFKKELKDKESHKVIDEAYEKCLAQKILTRNKLRKQYKFSIPVLAIKQGDLFEQFEKTHLLEYPWSLKNCDYKLTETEYSGKREKGSLGEIGLDDKGNLAVEFLDKLANDVLLFDSETNWTDTELAIWLDKNITHSDISANEAIAFILGAARSLISDRNLKIELLALDKLKLRQAVENKIDFYRLQAQRKAYQSLLFGADSPIQVSPELCFSFRPDDYPASTFYDGKYGTVIFKKHYYDELGNFDSKEEFECAQFIDHLDEIECWIRNLERRENSSFWLQTSTDKFYPDFVCKLKDGRYLVIEYKGAHLWADAEEKRKLGEIWEKRSDGKCLFVMPKGKDFDSIKQKIK
jgi:type III restriction enzyme